jgi:hypothetical protein
MQDRQTISEGFIWEAVDYLKIVFVLIVPGFMKNYNCFLQKYLLKGGWSYRTTFLLKDCLTKILFLYGGYGKVFEGDVC